MKIITDCEFGPEGFPNAYHFVETDKSPLNVVDHPEDASQKMDVIDSLTRFNNDKSLLDKAGWLEVSKLPGVPEGSTRWDVLCDKMNRTDTPQELKSLKFKPE